MELSRPPPSQIRRGIETGTCRPAARAAHRPPATSLSSSNCCSVSSNSYSASASSGSTRSRWSFRRLPGTSLDVDVRRPHICPEDERGGAEDCLMRHARNDNHRDPANAHVAACDTLHEEKG